MLGHGLPCPSQILADNYWVDSVSSANFYQSAHEPTAGGIPRIVSVSDGQSCQVVGLPGCGVAVCMAGQHTTSTHLNSSTYVLTGAQRNWPVHWGLPPLGYPWNLECGSLGSVHAPPLATPVQNFPFAHGGDAKRGQSVVPPVMTDTEISDSLLPGLPPPPTGPVVFRQSSVVPATAASGSSVSGQLNTSSAALTAPALTSSVSGQPATAVTTSHTDPTSSGSTSTAAGKPLVFTDEPTCQLLQ